MVILRSDLQKVGLKNSENVSMSTLQLDKILSFMKGIQYSLQRLNCDCIRFIWSNVQYDSLLWC